MVKASTLYACTLATVVRYTMPSKIHLDTVQKIASTWPVPVETVLYAGEMQPQTL
jgi:hypothetical protein